MHSLSNLELIWPEKYANHFIFASKSLKNHFHFYCFFLHVNFRVAGTTFMVYADKFGAFRKELAFCELDSAW